MGFSAASLCQTSCLARSSEAEDSVAPVPPHDQQIQHPVGIAVASWKDHLDPPDRSHQPVDRVARARICLDAGLEQLEPRVQVRPDRTEAGVEPTRLTGPEEPRLAARPDPRVGRPEPGGFSGRDPMSEPAIGRCRHPLSRAPSLCKQEAASDGDRRSGVRGDTEAAAGRTCSLQDHGTVMHRPGHRAGRRVPHRGGAHLHDERDGQHVGSTAKDPHMRAPVWNEDQSGASPGPDPMISDTIRSRSSADPNSIMTRPRFFPIWI